MGYDSLRVELRYRHIWQTKWAAAAASAKSVFLLFSASKVLIVKGMGPRWPVKVEVEEAPLEPQCC